jgi:hypothetical protein
MDNDHPTHNWRYSDSSYYDFVCKECGATEGSIKARAPCSTFLDKLKPGEWGCWHSPNRHKQT